MTSSVDRRRIVESRAGVVALLSAIWLIAAPVVMHFDAADIRFRPYWVAMMTATVIMVLSVFRIMAPLDVPLLTSITVVLASWLVFDAVVRDGGGHPAVLVNQVAFGGVIGFSSLVRAALTRSPKR